MSSVAVMSGGSAPAAVTRSIWAACRTGDTAYVRDFTCQEAEAQEERATRAARKRGGGAGGKAALASHLSSGWAPSPSCDVGVSQLDGRGVTALHVAVIYQQREAAQLLLAGGALATDTDLESGWTALHHALYRADFLTAHLLLRVSGPALATRLDPDHATAFDLVAAHVHETRRRREDNGNGRVAGGGQKFVRANALTSSSTAFDALAVDTNDQEEIPTYNLLYSLGYQSQYTLGYSCDHYQHRARMLDAVSSVSVRQVVALRQAVFVLLSDGTVTSHGQGQSGKLGHDAKETLIEPKVIRALHSITHISGTDDYFCAANEKGHVFAFGYSHFVTHDATTTTNASTSNKNASTHSAFRVQAGSHSPPLRPLDGGVSAASTVRYCQLPRRVDALRSLNVSQIFPSPNRLLVLTHTGDLWFIGQSLEDADRWESSPKRFAAAINEPIVQVCNRDDFVAILTTIGAIRVQRRGERKLNKLWLQNYVDAASSKESDRRTTTTIQDLFPLIPKAHVVKMSWTADGSRGAAVTREGQLFRWKLPAHETKAKGGNSATAADNIAPSSRTVHIFPRCIGYLVEGLAHVRVTDVAVANGHTTALTEDGHVYTFGPTCLGPVHPSDGAIGGASANATTSKGAAAHQAVLRPRRLMHLTQVAQIHVSEQYLLALVAVHQPPVLPSFPELHGLYESTRKPTTVQAPSLGIMCEHHIAEQITPLSALAAYQWAYQASCNHLMHYLAGYLLDNLAFFLPAIMAVPDVACLQYLQQEYAARFPLWWCSPAWTQPLHAEDPSLESPAGHRSSTKQPTTGATDDESESFSFSRAMATVAAAARKAAAPRSTEERVREIHHRRRTVCKKLAQIASFACDTTRKIDAAQRDRREALERERDELDEELRAMRDQGSISAGQLWDRLHGASSSSVSASTTAPRHEKPSEVKEPEAPTAIATESAVAAASSPASESARQAAEQEKAKSRVATSLLDRPVRALAAKSAKTEVEPESKSGRRKPPPATTATTTITSSTPPTPAATPATAAPSTSLSASAPSWKSTPTPAAVPIATAPAASATASSFLAIQAEEARLADLARAQEAARRSAARTPQRSGIVPAGGKGWGAPAIASPVMQATPTPKADFPSLGTASVAVTHPHASPQLHSSPSSSRTPHPLSVAASPPFRSAAVPTATSASGSGPSACFSLADFMPALASKPKPPVAAKGWNTASTVVEPIANKDTDTKRTRAIPGKSARPSSGTVSSPSLGSTSSAPVSFLSIQADQVEHFYGPGSAFKTQRELELELDFGGASQRTAWNSIHTGVSVHAQAGLADLQAQQLAQTLFEEEAARAKAAKLARQQAKKAEAKATRAALDASKPVKSATGRGPAPAKPRPDSAQPHAAHATNPSDPAGKTSGSDSSRPPKGGRPPKQDRKSDPRPATEPPRAEQREPRRRAKKANDAHAHAHAHADLPHAATTAQTTMQA